MEIIIKIIIMSPSEDEKLKPVREPLKNKVTSTKK